MKTQLIQTSDNSHTLYLPELDETYHSQNGAIAESLHVYIKAGLNHVAQTKGFIKIFEFGFGTGLNALLSWIEAENANKQLLYDTVEKYPISSEIYTQLNFDEQANGNGKLAKLHATNWGQQIIFDSSFIFQKTACDILVYPFQNNFYDVVYYDAFGPSKQAAVWEMAVLEKVCKSIAPNGVLVTYCSQGQFRRNLKSLGFEIEKLEGPVGKREITRATKR
jgi:tRNA U34 5-methylaminomethyl-2-thiouridine-forming methyltransferase MnmC